MVNRFTLACALLALFAAAPAFAQAQPSQAQLEANKKLVLDFFMNGNALADPQAAADKYMADDYVQHNAPMARYNEEHHVTGKVGFVEFLKGGGLRGIAGRRGGRGAGPARTPEAVLAQGDLVTVIWKNTGPVPGDPSQTYNFYTFDMFRIRNGKFVEHWDQTTLPPAAPAGAPAEGR